MQIRFLWPPGHNPISVDAESWSLIGEEWQPASVDNSSIIEGPPFVVPVGSTHPPDSIEWHVEASISGSEILRIRAQTVEHGMSDWSVPVQLNVPEPGLWLSLVAGAVFVSLLKRRQS